MVDEGITHSEINVPLLSPSHAVQILTHFKMSLQTRTLGCEIGQKSGKQAIKTIWYPSLRKGKGWKGIGKEKEKGKNGHYQGMMPMDIGAIEGEEQALQWAPAQEDFHGDNEWWTEEDYTADGDWPDDNEDNVFWKYLGLVIHVQYVRLLYMLQVVQPMDSQK